MEEISHTLDKMEGKYVMTDEQFADLVEMEKQIKDLDRAKKPTTTVEKHTVCTSCFCVGISDPNCICCYSNDYDTVELEFEVCSCGNIVNDGYPADTEFNKKQGK